MIDSVYFLFLRTESRYESNQKSFLSAHTLIHRNTINMAVRRRKAEIERKEAHPEQTISSSRAAKASFITFLSLFLLIIWGYHGYLVLNGVVFHNYEAHLVPKIVLNVSILMLHGWISLKALTYLNVVMLDNDIDSDHKKYL